VRLGELQEVNREPPITAAERDALESAQAIARLEADRAKWIYSIERTVEAEAIERECRRQHEPRPYGQPVIAIRETAVYESMRQAARAIRCTENDVRRSVETPGTFARNRQFVLADKTVLDWLCRHPGQPLTWKVYNELKGL
jgi:hypothetical protein